MKKEYPRLVNLTYFCPKLDRNVRATLDKVMFEADFEYGDVVLNIRCNCRCGEYHVIRHGYISGSVVSYLEYN